MFEPCGPNILSFVWISNLLLFYVDGFVSLSFYPIDFKPWHNDTLVLERCTSCSSGFIQDVGSMMYMSGEAQ